MDITKFVDAYLEKARRANNQDILKYLNREELDWNDSDALEYNISHTVSSLKRGKETALAVYRKFIADLEAKYNLSNLVSWPPIDINSPVERQLYILTYTQDHDADTDELSEKLWVSTRTIENDFAELMNSETFRSLGGHPLRISNMRRTNRNAHYETTAHPVQLVFNLSQLLTTLLGLQKMAENPLFEAAAIDAAAPIWAQMSEYAKNRICELVERSLGLDAQWFRKLPAVSLKSPAHHSDRETSGRSEGGKILFHIKTESTCTLKLYGEPEPLSGCKLLSADIRTGNITFSHQGEKRQVHISEIESVPDYLEYGKSRN